MLIRVAKPNYDGLHNAAKQLLSWALTKKQEFHTTCRTSGYDDDDDEDGKLSYRRSNRNWALELKKVDFSLDKLKTFKKNFYEPHPDVLKRSKEEVDAFLKEHDIHVFGRNKNNCPAPIFSFEELNLPEPTLNIIRKLRYTKPTPIQSQAWPIALSGYDMVGVSQTGSGKTLGFVIPALIHIQNQPPLEDDEGPISLFIAPTRELAQQIFAVTLPFARSMSLNAACIFGGASKLVQRKKLYGAHICIATPGRLMDFLKEGATNLHRCTYCVLDEADRLLDMGFEPQIQAVMSQVRPDKQTTMWSATWPKEVRHLAERFLKDYIGLKFGSVELAANPNIEQHIYNCERGEKRKLLFDILNDIRVEKDNKTLIFTKTKNDAELVTRLLHREGYSASFIHGDLKQTRRDELLMRFRRGVLNILVGTNVIARGLDVHDIRYVINYDFPRDIEEYVHLIGRTSRKNNLGTSHTFFSSEDYTHARDLVRILESSKQQVPEFLLRERNMAKAAGFNRMVVNSRSRQSGSMRYRF